MLTALLAENNRGAWALQQSIKKHNKAVFKDEETLSMVNVLLMFQHYDLNVNNGILLTETTVCLFPEQLKEPFWFTYCFSHSCYSVGQ